MHRQGFFFQIIEGEPEVIDDLFTRIQSNPRHNEIKIIFDSSVNSRLFPNWSMGCADFDEPELTLIPGIRTDLNDRKVIGYLINRLPEIATFLIHKLD